MPERIRVVKPYTPQRIRLLFERDRLKIPDYQRDEVWTESQKQLLIDSLMRNYDIPKLYFKMIDEGTYNREVVDGQQRIMSIIEFFAGAFKTLKDADPVDGFDIKNKKFDELHDDIQLAFMEESTLDGVELSGFTETEIKDIFYRLQNGTPLKAAEKRKVLPGNMPAVVEEMSRHQVFSLAGFANEHDAFENSAAQGLHIFLTGRLTSVSTASIEITYKNNRDITIENPTVKRLKRAYNFIFETFRGEAPGFKKFVFITLPWLVAELLDGYDLARHAEDFREAYKAFEIERTTNRERREDEVDPTLLEYDNSARADSLSKLRYRHNTLLEYIFKSVPDLEPKDPRRDFNDEQRLAIYWRDNKRCRICGPDSTELADTEFHADHIRPHSAGGPTTVANGQVLCIRHNLEKSATLPSGPAEGPPTTASQPADAS